MNTVCERDMCAGCMACIDICPRKAITIIDSLSAYNAEIDSENCINCNACHKICQVNQKPSFRAPIKWNQGWAANASIRKASSSGGAAVAIERAFINAGGIVYSCSFNEGEFVFKKAESDEEVKQFAGSKYVKSNPQGVYKEIKKLLQEQKQILLVGLPCQIAAARNICGNVDNLITVDLICHGSPSPKLITLFLKEYGYDIDRIGKISFRTKTRWHLKPEEKELTKPFISDYYTSAFLNGTIYTENCYSCSYAQLNRVSDITLGDSWGSELSAEEQKKGISLILMQTEKGIKLVEESDLLLFDVDIERAIAYNHQLKHPSIAPLQRNRFFELISKKGFKKAYETCYPKQHYKDLIKKVLYSLKLYGGGKA